MPTPPDLLQDLDRLRKRCAELTSLLEASERRAHIHELESKRLAQDLADLIVGFEQLDRGYLAVYDELYAARNAVARLQVEYGKAAARERMLEARVVGLLDRLLGEVGLAALTDLVTTEEIVVVERLSPTQQRLCALLGAERRPD